MNREPDNLSSYGKINLMIFKGGKKLCVYRSVFLQKGELVAALGYAICGLISALWQSFALGWHGTLFVEDFPGRSLDRIATDTRRRHKQSTGRPRPVDDVSPSGNALFILATYEHIQLWFTLLRGSPKSRQRWLFFPCGPSGRKGKVCVCPCGSVAN